MIITVCIGTLRGRLRAVLVQQNRLPPSGVGSCRVWRRCCLCTLLGSSRIADQLAVGRQQLPGAEADDRENYVQCEADQERRDGRHGDEIFGVGQFGKLLGPTPF